MMTAEQIAVLDAIKDDSVIELLMREYTILQDKIDKIGGFRFTIKGWALTLDTGAVVAAFATSVDRQLSIPLILVVAATLWLVELRQVHLSDIYQNRSLRIERAIMRRLTSHGLKHADVALLVNVPGIANEIRSPLESRNLSTMMKRGPIARWFFCLRPVAWVRRSEMPRKLIVADFYFYFLLWLFAALFIWFHHPANGPEKYEIPSAHIRQAIAASKRSRALTSGGAQWHVDEK